MKARGQTLAKIALALLFGHLAFGIARIPGKVWGQRLDEIEAYRRAGPIRHFVGVAARQGAAQIERLLAETPEDAVILWGGDWKGSLEFAPALLAPRLLVSAKRVAPDATRFADRPLATLADGSVLVLVGRGESLEIRPR